MKVKKYFFKSVRRYCIPISRAESGSTERNYKMWSQGATEESEGSRQSYFRDKDCYFILFVYFFVCVCRKSQFSSHIFKIHD